MGAIKDNKVKFLLVDLFCGAGGTSTGALNSGYVKLVACINHDPIAIKSHSANHRKVLHLTEDVVTADITPIIQALTQARQKYPDAKVILWASLECTNFSNAKGGLPRDADSRTLAYALFRYIKAIDPDYILIENVREFMAWGDLDANGKPVSKTNGRHYIRWTNEVRAMGYQYNWRMMNAADFGGVTIRTRYFGAFWKPGASFAWPQPTHVKAKVNEGMFADTRKPWRAVAEVLDFTDLGRSIFDRKVPYVDKTLLRILRGLEKFHVQPQVMHCYSPGYSRPVTGPTGTVTTRPSDYIITPILQHYYSSGSGNVSPITDPAPTLRTKDTAAMVVPFVVNQYGTSTGSSVGMPAGTVVTNPKFHLCAAFLVDPQYNNTPHSLGVPAPTILAGRKHFNMATAFIVNPQYTNKGHSISAPAPTVIASQGSYPLALAVALPTGEPKWIPQPGDTFAMLRLKVFMRRNGIHDIYMRMLKVVELKRIQGFPDDYKLHGTITEKKKHIGNSVELNVIEKWVTAIAEAT